jgi:maltokinase
VTKIDLAAVTPLLLERLPAHLAQQRWSGAHDVGVTDLTARWLEVGCEEADVALLWGVVDGRRGREDVSFQVFIGVRPAAAPPEFLHGKEREVVASIPQPGGDLLAYDALVDPDLAIAVLHLVAPDEEVEVRRPIVLEHSNSSVVFDERRILKLFRKIEGGPNPDVEITRELARLGSPHVLPPLAELHRDGTDLAVLREFIVGATEGWQMARTSVRDLLASRLSPEEAGGDFAPDAERLGVVLGELHALMAEAWGSEPADTSAWVAQMEEQLDEVSGEAGDRLPAGVDPEVIRGRYRHLLHLAGTGAGAQIRIHGDLHLAQVLRVDDGWRVLDFEGEPARRRDERFTTSSPLRDVAGILRSLHYAAATGLADWGDADGELSELASHWEDRNRVAFLRGYLDVDPAVELLPADEDARAEVLRAFELDKAVYELAYELAYRPDQAGIPAEGVVRLLNKELAG